MPDCQCKNNLCAFCARSPDEVATALAGGNLGQVQALFVRRWQPVFEAVCPAYRVDAATALKHAIGVSNWGDTALGSNLWGLTGEGDAGHVQSITVRKTGGQANGGIELITIPLAKFSSDSAAVAAWCAALPRYDQV